MCKGGGYGRHQLTLILLFFSTFSLFSQSKQIYKIIYFENLSSVGSIRPEISTRVRNQVSLNILRYFKSKYTLIDDSVIQEQLLLLKKQQNLGCDTDKCYKMIEDNLSPDEKITGNLQINGTKYILTLRLLDVNRGGGVVEQKEVSFTNNQLDYFVAELTRSLLDSRYKINMEGAPADLDPQKVELGTVQFKEVQGVDLKILEFKTQDSNADGILSVLNPDLQAGDSQFRSRKYETALNTYLTIQASLDKSLSEDSKKAIQEYYNALQKRIENTKTNLVTERLNGIDTRFKKLPKSVGSDTLEKFIQDYNNEITYMKTQMFTNIPLSKSIYERIRKLELKILELNEKEAEVMYDSYKFTESLRKYESIQSRIRKTDRLDSIEKKNLLSNLDKKIAVIRETGKSYYGNQIKTYCDLAEKEMLKVNLQRLKKESASSSKVKELLDKARDIIEGTRLIDIATLNYYNEKVDSINRSEKLGKKISISEIGSEEGLEESLSFSPAVVNTLFPGALHIDLEENVKGNIIRYSFFTSLLLFGGARASYNSSVNSYSSKDNPLLDYLILRNLSFETGFLYYTNQISSLDSVREDGVRIANAGNAAGIFALGLYLYSWTPALFGSRVSDTFLNENWKITFQPNITPTREGILNREVQFGFEGGF